MGLQDCLCRYPVKFQRSARNWASYYDHDYEVCKPYYYSVWLEDPDINLELTPGEKSSFYQIAWNRNEPKHLMLAVTTSGAMNVNG